MEIDIFPVPSAKGEHRNIGTSFLGLIIITYIVGAYMNVMWYHSLSNIVHAYS